MTQICEAFVAWAELCEVMSTICSVQLLSLNVMFSYA